MENAILTKLSALGRDVVLTQANPVILGYLKALGYGGLYSLKRAGLQRKLNAHMVKKKRWEPTDGDIELPTKKRSRKKKKPVIKKKKYVDFTLPISAAKNIIKKKTTKPAHDIGVKDSFAIDVLQIVPQSNSQTSEEKKDSQYVPKLVNVPNYPPMYTRYNPGEGNCFFYALQQGLEKLGVTFLNEADIRENLGQWFQEETNQVQMEAHIGGPPSSLIPQLQDTGLYTPAEGWNSYLADKDWGWWGDYVREQGSWVGALEVPIINQMLDNLGLNVVVNFFSWRYGRIFGNEHNGTKQVIMLYLSPGHFELLEEKPSLLNV